MTILMVVISYCLLSIHASRADSQRMDTQMRKKVDSLFKEAQHRRGPSLEARLTEIWQAVLPSDPEVEKYAKDNPRRHGALVYVRASGESREKTIRLFFYNNSQESLDGRLYSGIKDWFLPSPIAQSVAKNIAQKLSSDLETSYVATPECNDSKAEIVLSPRGGKALRNPLRGESLTQK